MTTDRSDEATGVFTMLALEDVRKIRPTKRRLRQGRRGKPCVYCGGQAPGTTMDHVFAETLFPVMPLDAITVPACDPCNNAKAVGDDILHVAVNGSPNAMHTPASHVHFGEIARSIARRQSPAAFAAWRAYRLRKQVDPLRLSRSDLPYPVDMPAFNTALQMMVRGLFFAVHGRILSADCPVDVLPYSQQDGAEMIFWLLSDANHYWGQRGQPDCEWIMTSPSLFGDDSVLCLFLFNRGVFFLGVTGRLARSLDQVESA
jgi:hypothetical protein